METRHPWVERRAASRDFCKPTTRLQDRYVLRFMSNDRKPEWGVPGTLYTLWLLTQPAAPAPPEPPRKTVQPPISRAAASQSHGPPGAACQNAIPPLPTARPKNCRQAQPAVLPKTAQPPAAAPRRPQFVNRSKILARRNATCFNATGPNVPAQASAMANGKKCAPSQLVTRKSIPFASPINSVLNR